MAKGRPDWTSSINITGQDLAEVIERPKYGSAATATRTHTVHEGDESDLISITGAGMIYGGILYHIGSFNPFNIKLSAVIDGQDIWALRITTLNVQMIEDKNMWHVYEKYYSEENDKYIQGLMPGITFEESWVFHLKNESGSGAFDATEMEVIYALI